MLKKLTASKILRIFIFKISFPFVWIVIADMFEHLIWNSSFNFKNCELGIVIFSYGVIKFVYLEEIKKKNWYTFCWRSGMEIKLFDRNIFEILGKCIYEAYQSSNIK